jgi:uncharacterized membrane protein YdbT with pleckstrin-like domain
LRSGVAAKAPSARFKSLAHFPGAVARPAPEDYIQPGEKALRREGRHALSVVDELITMAILVGALIAAVLLVALLGDLGDAAFPWAIGTVGLLVILYGSFALSRYWRVTTSRYVITSERVYKAYGRLRFFLLQTTYDKVTDIHVHQSFFGRIWGFGTVRLQTAGTGVALEGVRDPFAVKEAVEAARVAFVRALVEEHVARRGPRAVEEAPARTAARAGAPRLYETPQGASAAGPLWHGTPSWSYFTIQLLGLAIPLILVLIFTLVSLVTQQPVLLVLAGLFFLIVIVGASSLYIRQTHTRYEVHAWGVVVTTGWLSRRRVETTFEKVTDVTTYQGLVARLLDYGNITINTAGSNVAPVVFLGVGDPDGVKATIDEARARRRRA